MTPRLKPREKSHYLHTRVFSTKMMGEQQIVLYIRLFSHSNIMTYIPRHTSRSIPQILFAKVVSEGEERMLHRKRLSQARRSKLVDPLVSANDWDSCTFVGSTQSSARCYNLQLAAGPSGLLISFFVWDQIWLCSPSTQPFFLILIFACLHTICPSFAYHWGIFPCSVVILDYGFMFGVSFVLIPVVLKLPACFFVLSGAVLFASTDRPVSSPQQVYQVRLRRSTH